MKRSKLHPRTYPQRPNYLQGTDDLPRLIKHLEENGYQVKSSVGSSQLHTAISLAFHQELPIKND